MWFWLKVSWGKRSTLKPTDFPIFYFEAPKVLWNKTKFLYKAYLRRSGSTTDCCCLTNEMSNYFYTKFNAQHKNVKSSYKKKIMKSASFLPNWPDLLTFYFEEPKFLWNKMKFMYKVYLRRSESTTDCCCLTFIQSSTQHTNVIVI